MTKKIIGIALLACITLYCRPSVALHPTPAVTATSRKGPIQLTLRLYKKTVKREKSLWYQIELKNIGRKKILVIDRIFRDPWAMHDNIFHRGGIYIDITAPPGTYKGAIWPPNKRDGPSPQLRHGAGTIHYDYVGKGVPPAEGKAVNDELSKKEAIWDKQGLPESERAVKRHYFWSDWNEKKMDEEDRAKEFWLAPGASTTTFAWAYRNPDPYAVHSGDAADFADEEQPVGDYTQLWDYVFLYPGKYRIRAVYNYGSEETGKVNRTSSSPEFLEVKTPYSDFEVYP